MNTTTKRPQATKKFKALVAALGSEDKAITAWNVQYPDNPVKVETEALPEAVQKLVDAGFSVEEARKALATAGIETPAQAVPLTSQEQAEALIAKAGLTPVRGRIYSNTVVIEAQVRVLKTGKPEVVQLAGEHRTKAVALWRTEDGETVAVQNLGQPN